MFECSQRKSKVNGLGFFKVPPEIAVKQKYKQFKKKETYLLK